MDIVPGVFPAHRVQRKPVDVPFQSGDDGTEVVDRLPDPVEGASQHIRGQSDLHGMPGELCVCILQRHVLGAFKYLDDSFVLVDLDDASDLSLGAVHNELHDLVIERVLYALQCDQRAVDAA